jgi:hypothetical protein
VIFFVCVLPYLVPFAAIGGIVLLIVKLANKKKKGPQPPSNTPHT